MSALILRIDYLTGRCVSTAYNERDRAEWPPHPARVYSALVATWMESEEQRPEGREALEWLAALDAPSLYASSASHRQTVPHFVPVNDISVLDPFDRQNRKLDELALELEEAKAQMERVQGDARALAKAEKELSKKEKQLRTEQEKIGQAKLVDQSPYSPGKHPGAGLKSARALFPEHRVKQPRSFPSVSPREPHVFVRWTASSDEIERHLPALSELAQQVVRVGHSSSLVSCSWADDCPAPNWEPHGEGREVLRVSGPGQLELLEDSFARHQGVEPRVLPCRFQPYRRINEGTSVEVAPSCFGEDWIVFRQVNGRRLSATSAVELARALRGGLMKHALDPPPELLSGHAGDGAPSEKPHLAIVPLPYVGSQYASGELLGVALIVPRDAEEAQIERLFQAIGLWEQEARAREEDDLVDTPPLRLTLGRSGVIDVERVEWGLAPLKTLRSSSWCSPSKRWVTATPIALDRNPGDLTSRDPSKSEAAYQAAEEAIAVACERIGLPRPSSVDIHPSVPVRGGVKARAFPAFPPDPKKNQRVKVHARIEFPVDVQGPVLLGAGRYYGLGLCLPIPQENGTAE